MMMSCLCDVHAMQTPMMSCDICHMGWEWDTNHNDAMLMWFALYGNPNDIMLGMCNSCMHAWQKVNK